MNLSTQRDRLRAAASGVGRRWYEIRNATAPDRAVVRIYDEISLFGITAEQFAADLDAITAPELEVQINSPGGDVFDGIAIHNALRAHPARIITRVDGLAASIASVIVQAGDERIMASSAQMMLHKAWGVCVGNDDDMRDMAGVLARQNDVLVEIYAARSGKPAARFRDLMGAESWLTAREAVAEGLADSVLSTGVQDRVRNGFDPSLSLALLDL